MQESNSEWQRVVGFFEAALRLPEADREAWLRAQCGDAGRVYDEVHSLLAAAVEEQQATLEAPPLAGVEGRRYGVWEAIHLLGSGGMGSVLLVRRADGQYEQQAALKLVAAHLVSGYFLEQLKSERQILANLNHPNITKLVDGGVTEDGVPYLVMELVDGLPIDQYCDRHRLDVKARLRLFQTVCDAVQCAHQGLVAHLDLKPSNILVTGEGIPKLLDFGTARLFEQQGGKTTRRALTPDYASPEQLRGEPVTAACDIYSLGVILHELLAGSSPFGKRGDVAALAGRLADSEEPRPISEEVTQEAAACRSTSVTHLLRQLRGDLSLIVRKALASEPRRRYESPAALSEDLERYLEGRPIRAQRQTAIYHLSKFARRNRGAVAITTLLIVGLLTMGGYALWQQHRVVQEAERTRTVSRFLGNIFRLASPALAGRYGLTVRELLDSAEQMAEPTLGRDPAISSDVHSILAGGFAAQGQFAKALELQQKALHEAEQAHDQGRQAAALLSAASGEYAIGRVEPALQEADRAVLLLRRYGRSFTVEEKFAVLAGAGALGFYARPESPANLPLLQQAVTLARAHPHELDAFYLSFSLDTLAESHIAQRQFVEGEKLIHEAVALDRTTPYLAALLPEHLSGLARISRRMERPLDSERYQRESYQAARGQYGPENVETATQQSRWAFALVEIGAYEDAVRQAEDALRITRKALPNGGFSLWTPLATACYALDMTGRYEQAEELGREAIASLGAKPSPQDARWQETRGYLALALVGRKKYAEARPILEETLRYFNTVSRSAKFTERLSAALQQASR